MTANGDAIKVLLLEDVATDAELVERALRRDGIECRCRRVDSRETFAQALAGERPDIVLSDFRLPDMDGFDAIALARDASADLPVIIVTGALGDEAAARLLKAGATDYVLKDRLSRLPPAFRRALAEVAEIRERRAVEEALRQRQLILDSFFESPGAMRGVVELVGDDLLNLMVNTAAAAFMGRGVEEIRGRLASECGVPPDIIGLFARRCRESLNDSRPIRFDYLRPLPGREPRWLATTVSLIPETDGAGPRFAYSTQDITDAKAREDELRHTLERLRATQRQVVQAEKMSAIGTMAAGMAHELNNPLMGVINYVEYASELCGDAEVRDSLAKADRELERIRRLIKAMMAVAVPVDEPVAPVAVKDVVDRTLDLTASEWKTLGIAVEIDLPPDLPRAAAKPGALQQALLNVLLNARDAVRDRPRKHIRLAARAENGTVRIVIADSGPGVPEHLHERIFDPFFTTKPPGKGTGLGLSVTRSLIADMGGAIACESGPDGEGAAFTLTLPSAEAVGRPPAAQTSDA